jgi:hypothetical protein
MKYLEKYKIFEKFESSVISSLMGFLQKKLGNKHRGFFADFKKLMNIYKVPISKIDDSCVKYMRKSEALNMKSPESYYDKKDPYCLKFWFSLSGGYLGYTGVGNKSIDFNKFIKSFFKNVKDNEIFRQDELQNISSKITSTGVLIPVGRKNYETLNKGDTLIGYLGDCEGLHELTLFKLWINESGKFYAIQNTHDGESDGNRPDWESWGRYSWTLGYPHSPEDDHFKLHKYIQSNQPLYVGGKSDIRDGPSPFDFNLPIDNKGELVKWNKTNCYFKLIEESDFCVIIMLDDLLLKIKETTKDIQKLRNRSRLGSTALMDEDEIRKKLKKQRKKILKK